MGKKRFLRQAAAFFVLVLIAGCVPSHVKPVSEAPRPSVFPPRAVLESGDYKTFFTENSAVLKACPEPAKCSVALFNLCFLYAYPKSPYYDPSRALRYISDLVAGAPGTPWAAEAGVWRELIVREMKEKNLRRAMARRKLKSKEADLQDKAAMAKDWQVDRQILEDEIRSKDEIIGELTRQLKGSRKIDIEMEKKERGLPH